jgi:hypothetical protein
LIRSLGASLAFFASAATAQELELCDEKLFEGVYSQGWYGRVIGAGRTSGILVMVRGDGKSGDFYGVLFVLLLKPPMPTSSLYIFGTTEARTGRTTPVDTWYPSDTTASAHGSLTHLMGSCVVTRC